MRCADCGFYECAIRTPLGGCPNGEKSEHTQIINTPDTRPYDLGHGPFEKDYPPSGITIDPNKLPSEMRGLNDEGVKITEAIVYLTTHGWTCIAPQGIDAIAIQKAASDLVDAVDRYTMGKCLRSELLIKNNELRKVLKDE